jgi:eukaryotic-like serine/threonine-protein kinase
MNTPVHFGKYLLIDKVGTGGMAELFMAKQSGLKGFEKMTAIKRILPHLTQDGEFISMFINEAKLAALLTHQNIVQIFDLGHVENSYFIAMEYVMGKDLRTILQRAKTLNMPMTVSHALLIMSKVCAGLDYAHRKKDLSGQELNIVHRDISPQNILVSYEGEVKLVDFGIAKAASHGSETRTGILKGKLSYMAPEQAWGKAVDRRADIFAVGVILYEILTGHKLFKGDNDFNTLEKVREATVDPPITSLNEQVAPELEAIILKALAREADDRYQSASQMQTALEDHMSQKGYDFSTVRLAQYLQSLFLHDIEQDSQRFRIVGGAIGTTDPPGVADRSTAVRKHATSPETTPSHASRRLRTPVPPPAPAGPSIFRISILTVLILMGSATLFAMINPPFLESLSKSYPEVHAVTFRLSQWPAQTLERASALLRAGTGSPGPPSVSSVTPEPDLTEVLSNGPPAAVPPSVPSVIEPVSEELAAVPSEITEEPDRKLTPAEKEEVRMLLRDTRTAYAEHRLDDVERILRRIIDLNPKVPIVYHLLGTVMMERKDPDAAVRIFEDATRKFPAFPLLHYDLGFLYFRKGVVSLAQDELQTALTLNPGAPMAERARVIVKEIQDSPPDRSPDGVAGSAPLPQESSGSKP